MSRKIVLGVIAAGAVAACVFLIVIVIHGGLAAAGLWAGVVAAFAGVLAAAAAVWPLAPKRPAPLPPGLRLPDWAIGRPAELAAVVRALADRQAGTVGITTGLYGAGGFGKTTLAQMACVDRRVRRRFAGRVYLITVGQDVRGTAAIAAKVNDVIRLLTGEEAAYTDPQLAGVRLGSLLESGPRRLLVLDDVWEPEQLAPFTNGGKKCARLVTTRVPELLDSRDKAVLVDQMTEQQARALLTAGLPQLEEAVVRGLLAVTGRWPLLLRLVNKILRDYAKVAADTATVSAQATVLLEQLAADGPAAVDEFLREKQQGLDVRKPAERVQAVRATMAASSNLLDGPDVERFAELGIFAADETIPFHLVAALWKATAGLTELRAAQVCARLAGLALVSQQTGPDNGIAIHDVIRDYLRAELGEQRLAQLNSTLVEAVAARLPAVGRLDSAVGRQVAVAWWELGQQDRYMCDHLIEHLQDSGRPADAEAVACDLRWAELRLEWFGPAAMAADLAAAGTPRAARMLRVIDRAAHLLTPTDPPGGVVDVLHSRVGADPDWGPQVTAAAGALCRSRIVAQWPLPDLPDPALRRVLTGHKGSVWMVTPSPDGSWLATASDDRTVRVWDPATGRERAVLRTHSDFFKASVAAVAPAPDSSWLAIVSPLGKVEIWEAVTGRTRSFAESGYSVLPNAVVAMAKDGSWLAVGRRSGSAQICYTATGQYHNLLTGGGPTRFGYAHKPAVNAVARPSDGSWLATADSEGNVRFWETGTGRPRIALKIPGGSVDALAVAPDGSWLATVSGDGTALILDIVTASKRATLHTGRVTAVAVAPDGSWLATGGSDGDVRIWDALTGGMRALLEGHTARVTAVAVAPDGSWIATASQDGTARIWDTDTSRERAALPRHIPQVLAPDGSWIATSGCHGTLRVQYTSAGRKRDTLERSARWTWPVAVAPDGTWIATGGQDGKARIWDTVSGRERVALTGHASLITAMATAPDGTWLATADRQGTVRIWDVTRRERAALTGSVGPVEDVTASPDGSWLASAGRDSVVRIWDAATGSEVATLTGHEGPVTAIAAAPDSCWLASASHDGMVRIWDVAAGQERQILTRHAGPVTAMATAPDGSWLATATGWGRVGIWDTTSGRLRAVMKGPPRSEWGGPTVEVPVAVAVAPDGTWLATAGTDKTVRVWDTATGRKTAVVKGRARKVPAVAVAIAPDGRSLAIADTDGTVRIWDTAIGQERAVMKGGADRVVAVGMAPDGRWLAAVCQDGTVRIWDTATGDPQALMRVDGTISSSAWLGSTALVIGGSAGLYLFHIIPGSMQAAG